MAGKKKPTRKTAAKTKLGKKKPGKIKRCYDPFAEVAAEVNAAAGEDGDTVCLWEEESLADIRFQISTGSNLLDLVLGGGFPSGRVVEVAGWEGTAKTTLGTHVGASCQAMGGYFYNMDAEVAEDRKRSNRIGVRPDKYLYGRVDTVEDGFISIHKFLDSIQQIPAKYRAMAKEADKADKAALIAKSEREENVPSVIFWDTIAATPTRSEVASVKGEGKKFAEGMASKARIVREGLRTLTNKLADTNTLLLIGNHLIENLRGFPPESAAGHAIKYWASIRLFMRRTGKMVINAREAGIYVKAIVKKSKVSPQGYEVVFPVNFEEGIDRVYEAFDYLYSTKKGVVTQSGAWYKINHYPEAGAQTSLYYKDLSNLVKEDSKLLKYLIKCMTDIFYGKYINPDGKAVQK